MSHQLSSLEVRTITVNSDESWSRGRHVPLPPGKTRRLDDVIWQQVTI